ncbi:MAG: hypothetical protein ACI857_002585 [Arenicella sp.]|jgi:hypothetical protein
MKVHLIIILLFGLVSCNPKNSETVEINEESDWFMTEHNIDLFSSQNIQGEWYGEDAIDLNNDGTNDLQFYLTGFQPSGDSTVSTELIVKILNPNVSIDENPAAADYYYNFTETTENFWGTFPRIIHEHQYSCSQDNVVGQYTSNNFSNFYNSGSILQKSNFNPSTSDELKMLISNSSHESFQFNGGGDSLIGTAHPYFTHCLSPEYFEFKYLWFKLETEKETCHGWVSVKILQNNLVQILKSGIES